MASRDASGNQSFITVAGTAYVLNYDIIDIDLSAPDGTATAKIGTSLEASDIASAPILTNGSKTLNFTATTAATFVSFQLIDTGSAGSGSTLFYVDNVSVIIEQFAVVRAGGLAQLIAGIAANHESTRIFLEALGHIRDPYKTTILETLEREYGLPQSEDITETERRDKLAAVKYAKAGTGSIDNMQIALDRAFPGLFTVYDNDPPQDPTEFVTPEMLTDADMEVANTFAWPAGNNATITKEVASPIEGARNLKVARSTSANPYAFQNVIITGGVYNIQGWARGDGSASPKVWLGTNPVWVGTTSTSWQYFNVQGAVASFGSFGVRLESTTNTGTQFCEFDDFRLTQTQIGRTIVNGRVYNSHNVLYGECGEADAQCGELDVQCGNVIDVVKSLNVYPIPNDSQYWSLIFFVGGASTVAPSSGFQMEAGEALAQCGEPFAQCGQAQGQITSMGEIEVPIERRHDLEHLILALKPLHSWGVLFAVYQLILNGDFSDDTTWVLGTGWNIIGNECVHTPGTGASIFELNRGVVSGFRYRITYTLSSVVAGSIQPFVGSTSAGTARTSSGTYTEVITATGTDSIAWTCNAAFDGVIDDISVLEL